MVNILSKNLSNVENQGDNFRATVSDNDILIMTMFFPANSCFCLMVTKTKFLDWVLLNP